MTPATEQKITVEQRGHILLIGLNRPAKRNAFDVEMLEQLALAYTELENNDEIRCGVLFAHGEMFTAGLDLANVAPQVVKGNGGLKFSADSVDPLNLYSERTKPVVVAVNGKCLTVGIELILAADICVAAENATFAQIEIKRGIFPFGGATLRFPERSGWGNAMRWLLTGDEFAVQLALGISEALVNTALGLITAIVGIVLHNYFSTRVENIGSTMEEAAFDVLQILRERREA